MSITCLASVASQESFDTLCVTVYKVQWQSEVVGAMFHCFLVEGEKRGMEDWVDPPAGGDAEVVMVEEAPISFSPFSLADCSLFSHFSFDDFIVTAFPDLAEDLDLNL